MKIKHIWSPLLLVIVILGTSCTRNTDPYILISKEYKPEIRSWLSAVDDNYIFINMYNVSRDSIDIYLSMASGILISGGPDVNPVLYDKGDELDRCEEIDYWRDTLETRMITYALDNKVPLLGICRGNQIINVICGGTLITDIPADFDTIIKHRGGTNRHYIELVEGTLLSEICGIRGDTVNSYHHQAIEVPAPVFIPAAFADDGLIEAIELIDTSFHPFVLGVQWHPEGMDPESQLAGPIAKRFLKEVSIKSIKKETPAF